VAACSFPHSGVNAVENKIPFYDYTENKKFKRKIFFRDFGHLNRNGAKLFSAK